MDLKENEGKKGRKIKKLKINYMKKLFSLVLKLALWSIFFSSQNYYLNTQLQLKIYSVYYEYFESS